MRRKRKGNDFRSQINVFACNINWPKGVEIKLDFIYLLLKIPIIKKNNSYKHMVQDYQS